ncbi:MAG: GNAT family N-acetyltransferase [Lachnospiraceae bacterium]|nr:GNAT family N-acetyltransferase [Lachnospiraceae bacterium]
MSSYIRAVTETEYSDAMETVWKIFLKFNSSDYGIEGIDNFRKFLVDELLYKMYMNGVYRVFAFFADEKIEGVASVRNQNHLSLLFVSGEYQKRGVGTALLNYVCKYCSEYEGQKEITVNSSRFAQDFYRKYGFTETGDEQESDGIRYLPMKYVINSGGKD